MAPYDKYKTSIIECTQWLAVNGYFGALRGTGGNVSMRVEGEKAFVITPSTLPYDQLTLEDMCVVDFDMNPIEGERKPSVESGFHLAVYKNRKDINAVIHTHQVEGSVFSILNQPIPPLFDEVALHIGHIVDVIPYALSGSPELIDNVVSMLDNLCHGYLMQNHGVLNLGATLERAWLNVELLEKSAVVYSKALSTGNKPSLLPDDIVNLLKELRKAEIEELIAKKN